MSVPRSETSIAVHSNSRQSRTMQPFSDMLYSIEDGVCGGGSLTTQASAGTSPDWGCYLSSTKQRCGSTWRGEP
jgi:hypothetical protein